MKELKGTKTEKNLMEAFAGESMARNKYTYFASKAKKDGFEQISKIFLETADNEKEHAKLWYKYPALFYNSRCPRQNTHGTGYCRSDRSQVWARRSRASP